MLGTKCPTAWGDGDLSIYFAIAFQPSLALGTKNGIALEGVAEVCSYRQSWDN